MPSISIAQEEDFEVRVRVMTRRVRIGFVTIGLSLILTGCYYRNPQFGIVSMMVMMTEP